MLFFCELTPSYSLFLNTLHMQLVIPVSVQLNMNNYVISFYSDGPLAVSVSPQNKTYTQVEGSVIDVTCSAQCWPCTYRWTGQGSWVSNGPRLHVTNLRRVHHGQFTCTVTNSKTNLQQNVYINVQVICKF